MSPVLDPIRRTNNDGDEGASTDERIADGAGDTGILDMLKQAPVKI